MQARMSCLLAILLVFGCSRPSAEIEAMEALAAEARPVSGRSIYPASELLWIYPVGWAGGKFVPELAFVADTVIEQWEHLRVLLGADEAKRNRILTDYLARVPNDNETLGPVGAACLVIRQVWLTERVKVPIYARRPDPGNFIAWPGPILRQLRRLAQEPEPTGLYALRALATTYDEDSAREMIDLVVTRQGKIQEQAFLNLAHYRRAGVILETVRVDFIDAAVQIATRRLPTEDAYVWAVQVALDEGSVASLLMACEELPSRMGGPRSAKLALQPFFETPLPDNDLAEWCRERKWSYDSEKRKFLQVE